MVISGLLVNAVPDRFDQVQRKISSMKDVEINSILDESRMVIVIHAGSMEEKKSISQEIAGIEGVRSVNVAYDHFEASDVNGKNAR